MRIGLLVLAAALPLPALVVPSGPEPGPTLDWYGDPLPDGIAARLGSVRFLSIHAGAIAYSPDGTRLAMASPSTLAVWDARTGRPLLERSWEVALNWRRPDPVVGLAFSPDGSLLAYGPGQRPIQLLSVDDAAMRPLDFTAGSVAFTPDGRRLVAVGPREIRVLPVAGGPPVNVWPVGPDPAPAPGRFHGPYLGRAALSPDGTTLAVAGREYSHQPGGPDQDRPDQLRVFDLATGEVARHPLAVEQVAFRPDGSALAADVGSAVVLLDPRSGQRLGRWPVEGGDGTTLAFSPDGALLTAHGHLYTADGKAVRPLDDRGPLAFAPDGRELAVAAGFRIAVCDARSGKPTRPYFGHGDNIYSLTALADGRTVATDDRTCLRFWDAATGEPLVRPVRLAVGEVLPGGRWGANRVEVRDLKTGRLAGAVPVADYPLWLAVSNCGRTLLYMTRDPAAVHLVDVPTGRLNQRLDFEPEIILDAALSPDGTLAATADQPGAIRLWDTATGRVRTTLAPPFADGATTSARVVFSPDGRLLASMRAKDNALRLWDVETGGLLRTVRLLADPENDRWHDCTGFVFSPDGRLLVTTGNDSIRVWEVATLRERFRFAEPAWRAAVVGRHRLVTADWEPWAHVRDLAALADAANAAGPARDANALWAALADDDPAKAYRAGRALTATPGAAVALLKERLRPVPIPDPHQLRARVADLDADDFETRERATAALARLGEAALPALSAARRTTTPEQRRRIDALLDARFGPPHPDRLRVLRAIEVLEDVATRPARAVLQSLAAGAPNAEETRHAKAALERLGRGP